MKKKIVAMILTMALSLTAVVFPACETKAQEKDAVILNEVETELSKTASYMIGQLKENVITNGNPVSYLDYQDAMFCLKAGIADKDVILFLNEALSSQASNETNFLNPYASEGMQTYTYAVAVLYLQEIGEDAHSYAGVDFTARLLESYEKEAMPNPYVYPFLNAAADKEETRKKVAQDVFSYYVDDATGSGIDYWGVSADNNGQVLTALADEYKKDESVKKKVDAALDWNAAQCDENGAVVSWGAPNPNATALALRAAAEFGRMDEAENYYKALKQFASANTPGAYTYMGEDSLFSSRDALTGFLAYRNALEGKTLFAVTDTYKNMMQASEPTPEAATDLSETKQTSKEVENETVNAAASQSAVLAAAPRTGDESRILFFVVLAGMAAAVLAAVKGGRRKNGQNQADSSTD